MTPLHRLVEKWRKQAEILRTDKPEFSDGLAASREECANDLEAELLREPAEEPVAKSELDIAMREIAAAMYAYAHHNWDWKAVVIGISDGAHIEFAAAREMRGRNHES